MGESFEKRCPHGFVFLKNRIHDKALRGQAFNDVIQANAPFVPFQQQGINSREEDLLGLDKIKLRAFDIHLEQMAAGRAKMSAPMLLELEAGDLYLCPFA